MSVVTMATALHASQYLQHPISRPKLHPLLGFRLRSPVAYLMSCCSMVLIHITPDIAYTPGTCNILVTGLLGKGS